MPKIDYLRLLVGDSAAPSVERGEQEMLGAIAMTALGNAGVSCLADQRGVNRSAIRSVDELEHVVPLPLKGPETPLQTTHGT